MLFWRNIANTGTEGPVDRMTLMTIEAPPTLVSLANPTASLIDKESGGAGVLVHQLSEQRGDTTYVYAFFSGRPGATALAPISKEVFLGRQNPLTSYNVKSKTITVPGTTAKPGS